MLSIMETLGKWAETFKEFIIRNHTNPFLWAGIILIALAIFGIVYSALHKD